MCIRQRNGILAPGLCFPLLTVEALALTVIDIIGVFIHEWTFCQFTLYSVSCHIVQSVMLTVHLQGENAQIGMVLNFCYTDYHYVAISSELPWKDLVTFEVQETAAMHCLSVFSQADFKGLGCGRGLGGVCDHIK